ncbi:unnamed protein product [Cylicostephanus goldi]|uniref:Uncharacterized protein n=1 Tax=Cylicostephanus goldi TaxID=71465 RepID=A0A3P7N3K8_CYLGO|nr:unnamed protein product [Cylicostephanus goldi]
MVSHVIFDLDGLLLDTETIYEAVLEKLMKKHDKEFTKELAGNIKGQKERNALEYLLKELDIADVNIDECMDEYDSILMEEFRHCKEMPGAERLIQHLHDKGKIQYLLI